MGLARDRDILDAADRRDHHAVAKLIMEGEGPSLMGFLRCLLPRPDAEDVFQETVLAAVDALIEGQYRREASVAHYLRGIARNKAFRLKGSLWHRLAQPSDSSVFDRIPAEEPAAVDDWDSISVPELLERLDTRQRVVVQMRLRKWSFREIGQLLDISEDNAAQIYSRAIRRLQRALQ